MDLTIRNAIISELNNYLDYQVILQDQAAKKPGYPYVAVKFTTPYIPETGMPAETLDKVPSSDPNFEYDIEFTQSTMPTAILSLTAYSKDFDQSYDLAKQAFDWFSFFGYQYLKLNGIVVAKKGNIQNRDTLIVGDYERRQGFDVTLRVTETLKRIENTIETFNIKEVEK